MSQKTSLFYDIVFFSNQMNMFDIRTTKTNPQIQQIKQKYRVRRHLACEKANNTK